MNVSDRRSHIWAVVPAAGAGRRMGAAKQSLPYRGSTLAGVVVRTLLDAGVDGLVVVTRTPLAGALDLPDDARVRIAFNDDPASEMIDSVRIGLDELNRLDHVRPQAHDGVLVVPADMPALSVTACRKTIAAFVENPEKIVIATHASRRGHPIVFPYRMHGLVTRMQGGLNDLPRRHPEQVRCIEVRDSSVTRDVDTAADYDRLQSRDAGKRRRANGGT